MDAYFMQNTHRCYQWGWRAPRGVSEKSIINRQTTLLYKELIPIYRSVPFKTYLRQSLIVTLRCQGDLVPVKVSVQYINV